MINPEAVIQEIDSVLAVYAEYQQKSKYEDLSDLKRGIKNEILTVLAAAIDRLAPPGTAYRKNAESALNEHGRDNGYNVTILVGILKALRTDIKANRLKNIAELIHANLFADFLEMAEHLYAEGYKDAAAVIAGSVLEGHLRKLCERHSIPVEENGKTRKADLINAELAKAGIYNKLEQKAVTAWLGLRNAAAHGSYNEYSKEQVRVLLDGIRDFSSRHAA